MNVSFCAGSSTSSSALAGSPWNDDAELVDLVEQEDRVLGAGLLHPLDDAAGHRADVGAAVAADVGLVAHAAERDAHVLAPERAGDRLGDRGLADARRADEEQDRPLRHRAGLRLLRVGDRPLVVLGAQRRRRVVLVGLERRRPGPRPSSRPRRASCLRAELAHREELEHAVLHVLQAVVVLVEDPDRRCLRSSWSSERVFHGSSAIHSR